MIHMLKDFRHDRMGMLRRGATVDMPEPWATWCIKNGYAESYQTKVIRETPLPVAGVVQPLSASPAAQASAPTIASESGSGGKRKGRPKKASSSQTQPLE